VKVVVPRETAEYERRVACVPDAVTRLRAAGLSVAIERGAGASAGYLDEAYVAVGADIVDRAALKLADVVLAVQPLPLADAATLREGALVLSFLQPAAVPELIESFAEHKVNAMSLERLPRISRAQSMDALSSQSLVIGYRAALIAAERLPRFFPLLMTAAGTVPPAKVLVLGAGVAGLQAIATAKRLGAVIEASDVRPSVKEQVESLGARFIDVPYETAEEKEAAVGVGGYAKPMPQGWLDRQKVEVAKRVAAADIVISTALIPGRAAPVLVTEEMVRSMKPGSVIVDLAAGKGPDGKGGNCPLSVADQTVVVHGVTIVGETNLAARVGADASALYARNVLDFLKLVLTKESTFHVPMDDDIVAACLVTQGGDVKRK